jgi:DNA-binding NarL/FixJ family response regulator
MNTLIIEQSVEVSRRLKSLLLEETPYNLILEADTLMKAAEIIENNKPVIILLDLSIQQNHLSRFLTDTKISCSKSVIIALTIQDISHQLKTEKIEGVDYVLDKYEDFEKLPDLIRNILFNKKEQLLEKPDINEL